MARFYRYYFTRSEMRGVVLLSIGTLVIRLLIWRVGPAAAAVEGDAVFAGKSGSDPQVKPKTAKTEINGADSTALLELPGIGPVFAGRIIQYRRKLGGYVSKSQLLEVYGMDSARWQGLISHVRVDTSRVRKLDLNRATFKELLAHPYLEYGEVKAVARFRDRAGPLVSVGQLRAAGVLPDSILAKMIPYLTVIPDTMPKE